MTNMTAVNQLEIGTHPAYMTRENRPAWRKGTINWLLNMYPVLSMHSTSTSLAQTKFRNNYGYAVDLTADPKATITASEFISNGGGVRVSNCKLAVVGSMFVNNVQNAIEIVRVGVLSVSSSSFVSNRVGIQTYNGSTKAVVKLWNVTFASNKHVGFFCRVGRQSDTTTARTEFRSYTC